MRNRIFLLLLFVAPFALRAQSFDLTMQAWYWDYFQNGNYGNWINNLNAKAVPLKNAGFKNIWLPPLSRSSTTNNISNGYNPKDLYDLGEFGPACAWGTRAQLNTLISNYNANGLNVVSDMIYNHRDGGKPEKNTAVRYFITDPSNAVWYPSDRFFCVLPLGSANPGNNGAGDYYIKVRSKSQGYSNGYKFYARTKNTAYAGAINETEPNGGGDCGQNVSQVCPLGTDIIANLGPDNTGCRIDEFKITLSGSNFNATDDTLFIYMTNTNGYSDHYVIGLWSAPRAANIENELQYWTYTDFNNQPSGQGSQDYNGFRPNDNTANAGGVTEDFSWPYNYPLFFYDYDQSQPSTYNLLNAWTKWELQQGIKGLRMDAVKHFDPQFTGQLMNYLKANNTVPQFVVGEFFDYDAGVLNNWVNAVYGYMTPAAQGSIKVRAFDFALRGALRDACDAFGNDVRNVFNSGMVDGAGGDPFNVVTFVDNHDIRQEGNAIQNDAKLVYAYILTNNQIGAPCVFYPDYYGVQVGNAPLIHLEDEINDLVTLHKTYILNSPNADYLSRQSTPYYQFFVQNGNNGIKETSLIYQLQANGSGKTVIVAINFSGTPLDMYQGVNTSWGATPGTTFTDMLGTSGIQNTNITPNSEIHVTLPPRSYTVWVQGVNTPLHTPLPVELLDFQAFPERESVLLKWSAASEKAFSHYEIERSTDDAQDFKSIGKQEGASGSSTTGNYIFRDEHPVQNTPLYYRLKMVNSDGSFEYSPIRQLTLQRRSFDAFVAPNPSVTSSKLYLNTLQAQNFKLNFVNALGQVVYTQPFFAEEGDTDLTLPVLDRGIYTLVLQGELEQIVLQFVKNP